MLEHNDDGGLGVVLNRPSETRLKDVLPLWARSAADPPVAFVGGPVGHRQLIAVGLDNTTGEVEVLDLNDDQPPAHVSEIRIFAGYAGWTAGQLEDELELGAWWVVDAEPADAVGDDPEDLWRAVLLRQRPPLRNYASYPRDPALN